jgi:hypothetical protein
MIFPPRPAEFLVILQPRFALLYDSKHTGKYFGVPPKISLDNSSNDEYIERQEAPNTKSEIILQSSKSKIQSVFHEFRKL